MQDRIQIPDTMCNNYQGQGQSHSQMFVDKLLNGYRHVHEHIYKKCQTLVYIMENQVIAYCQLT